MTVAGLVSHLIAPYVADMKFLPSLILSGLLLTACDGIPVSDGAQRKVDAARERNDAPAIWRVQDEDSTLYLFGTVHLLPETLNWQRDDLRDVFDEAGTVFFEADSSGPAAIRAEALVAQRGLRRDGLRLTDRLDSYQSKLLEAVTNNGGIALEAVDAMQPWLASEFLTLSAAQSAGLSANLSADEALKSRAMRGGKAVIYFESAEDQIEHVANLSESIQLDLLTDTMERFSDIPAMLTNVADAWVIGDVQTLETLITTPLEQAPDSYVEAVFTERNEAWANELDRFMQGSGTGFVAVGTAHLIGEESLITALEDKGYDVQRYLAFMGEDLIKPINPTLPDVPGSND